MALDYTELNDRIPSTYEEFKDAYQNGNNPASDYYEELKNQLIADGQLEEASYAATAQNVTEDSGFDGQFANAYSENVAEDNGVDFSVGSDAWLRMQYELMKNDLAAREASGDGTLNAENKNEIHADALEEAGLPPETFSAYVPTEALSEVNPDLANELMQELTTDDGFGDNFILDGLALDILNDWNDTTTADYYKWLKDVLDTFIENPDLLSQAAQNELNDLLEAAGGAAAPWALDMLKDVLLPQWLDDFLDDWGFGKEYTSPLVLDLDGNGIELASVLGSDAVFWDIDEDGFVERTGWVAGDDGLLVIDLNNDGIINDHSELFGNDTIDGFTALSAYDSNLDGVIDSNDAQFSDLQVWIDANANEFSENNELFDLSTLGITDINLNATLVDYHIEGNNITHESTFTINGQTQTIVDAWFAYDNTNSHFAGEYTLDIRTLFLPSVRGFGDVADLHIAMSQDETLLLMVQEIAASDLQTLFDPVFNLQQKLIDILFRWTGADSVDPASRGSYFDAQKLVAMEAFFGDDFALTTGENTPQTPGAVNHMNTLFEQFFGTIAHQLLSQTNARSVLGDGLTYDMATGVVTGSETGSLHFSDIFQTGSETFDTDNVYVFEGVNQNLTILEKGGTDTIFLAGATSGDVRLHKFGSDLGIHVNQYTITAMNQFSSYSDDGQFERIVLGDGTVLDLTNNFVFTGTDNGEHVSGTDVSDTLYGLGGDDIQYGYDGDDTLIGGQGIDSLYGGAGNDIYEWSVGDGNDYIGDESGNDSIRLTGLNQSDVRMMTAGNDLHIWIGSEKITVMNQFSPYYPDAQIESVILDDGTILDLTNNIVFTGTENGEHVSGTDVSDTLYGLGGDDIQYGYDGDDTLIGGQGNDSLYGGAGNDIYEWSMGDGNDYIGDESGNDSIRLTGLNQSDVRMMTAGNDLHIWIGSEKITIVNQTSPYHSDAQIETIILDDDTIDLTQNLTLSGTETSEYLHGTYGDERILALGGHDIIYAYSGNDTLHGGDGIDTLYGQNGDDILYGENDSDYIFGGYGSDVLIGGDGKDYLYGQGDTDTFAFESSSAFNNIDVIEDFKLSEQDKLDISDLLQSYDPVSDAITDFVQITEVNYTSYLEVDVDGGGDDFVRIAQINNTTGITDEYALVNLGHLIV